MSDLPRIGGMKPSLIDNPEWLKDVEVRSSEIDATLAYRQSTHGDFADVAFRAQEIKTSFHYGTRWHTLSPVQMESLEMLATKLARLVEGDPDFEDHTVDAIGYLTLMLNDLRSRK
jgi:hypothetical protein